MNTQTLGALSSDQKIDKVFHAFGYSVPVGKDGRCLWPTKFKREMAHRMRSGIRGPRLEACHGQRYPFLRRELWRVNNAMICRPSGAITNF